MSVFGSPPVAGTFLLKQKCPDRLSHPPSILCQPTHQSISWQGLGLGLASGVPALLAGPSLPACPRPYSQRWELDSSRRPQVRIEPRLTPNWQATGLISAEGLQNAIWALKEGSGSGSDKKLSLGSFEAFGNCRLVPIFVVVKLPSPTNNLHQAQAERQAK